jgi:glycosyltransferase involved in cell wall biosynthesis
MAMAKPIIASSLDQIAEVLQPALLLEEARTADQWRPGDLAILTRPGSVEDIVEALHVLRDHPAWHQPMGDAARRKTLACYTWRQHVDHIMNSL